MKSFALIAIMLFAITNAQDGCDEGFVPDCADDDCCPESWLADELCDGDDQEWGCDLTCYVEEFGDCGVFTGDLDCGEDGVQDCAPEPDCCPVSWLDDGLCDGVDQEWGCDLSCYGDEFADCVAEICGDGYVADCAPEMDCCPESWLADELCDGVDQEWGCDLSCYEAEAGDCGYITCGDDEVHDCFDLECCPGSWIGDGLCDGWDEEWGCDLSCYEGEFGDCGYISCDEGFIPDCAPEADCCPVSWLNDGLCDGVDQEWGCDLTCYGQDGNDCCPEDTIVDCSDLDCCPASWLSDGYCDGVDQEWGCDLSCYENDGGDC